MKGLLITALACAVSMPLLAATETVDGVSIPSGVTGYKDKGYTFVGWSPAIAPMTKSQTYTAVFNK